MENILITPYKQEYYTLWNEFVAESDTAFLFNRDFMEYHKDRFEDFSLLVFDNDNLIAIVPAHKKDSELYSHWGLTFGGILVKKDIKIEFSFLVNSISEWLRTQHFSHWHIKPILKCYHSENMDFQWERYGFREISVDENLILDYNDFSIHKNKLKHYRKNISLGYQIKEEEPDNFWREILIPLLKEKYNTQPVHSLQEIKKLQSLFPNNIRHFSLYYQEKLLAGITIFENTYIVKSQYGSVSEEGKKIRALDNLFIYLIDYYQNMGKKYFDMGTVMDNNFPNRINTGLKNQKIELGCGVIEYLIKYTKIL